MPRLICIFHDIVADIEHKEKENILREANAEVLGSPALDFEGLRSLDPSETRRERISRSAYRQLVD